MPRSILSVEIARLDELVAAEKNRIDQILAGSSQATIFNDIDLAGIVAGFYKSHTAFVSLLKVDGSIEGYLVYYLENAGKMKTILSPLQESLLPYGGFVMTNAAKENEAVFIKKAGRLLSTTWASVYIKSNPNISIDMFDKNGWRISEKLTLKIDLNRPINDIYGEVDNRIRRNLKKAQNNSLTIKVITPDRVEDVAELARIYFDLCQAKGLPFHSVNYYYDMLHLLSKKYGVRIFYALLGEQVIAAMSVCMFKDMINPWFGATMAEYARTEAGTLLYWEIIKYGNENGYKQYDFLGLDIGPISFYKRGFGGYEVPVYHLTKTTLIRKLYKRMGRWAK